jgi:hypothetical protein
MMTADEVGRLTDYLCGRRLGTHRLDPLVTDRGPPGAEWAGPWGHGGRLTTVHAAGMKHDCEPTAVSAAVVVLGDPTPWRPLVRLTRHTGVPVRVFRGRRMPPLGRSFDADDGDSRPGASHHIQTSFSS